MTPALESVTLGGGCFWCLQPVFEDLRGVGKVEVGYAGGVTKDPTYEEVCTGRTQHAEVVQVTFDPAAIPFEDILRVFFTIHNPTTLNRQGADSGTQYRSAVYYNTATQKTSTERVIAELGAKGLWDSPIVTEVAPLSTFYRGESYHQNYYRKNPYAGYCRAVVAPKVAKFRKEFAAKLKR